jgi:hypothetical protein
LGKIFVKYSKVLIYKELYEINKINRSIIKVKKQYKLTFLKLSLLNMLPGKIKSSLKIERGRVAYL